MPLIVNLFPVYDAKFYPFFMIPYKKAFETIKQIILLNFVNLLQLYSHSTIFDMEIVIVIQYSKIVQYNIIKIFLHG